MKSYKAIVADFVEREAENFLDDVLTENGYKYDFVLRDAPATLERNKEYDTIFFEVAFKVYTGDLYMPTVTVAGTVGDIAGICCSCIYCRGSLVWMSTEKARRERGIDKLEIG